MKVMDIVNTFKNITGHKNFPRSIDEMNVLLEILKPSNNDEVLITGAGVSNVNGTTEIVDDSELIRLLNNIGRGSLNANFEPRNDLEEAFIIRLKLNGTINKNLQEIKLSDLYSEDDINSYNTRLSNCNEWNYYHENYKDDKAMGMDALTRLCYE